ncbi:hypothetical protein [Psychrobacter sp. K31L]|uniref:hypothetical protein n=1 Tax=Psychrobacter sp. K31L TaxID=2820758 RepID=UPI001B33F243|nr:hypothetical protein [Psychrobacter sp. K31L]MBP3946760.1 hypothetical protein [Psychrobacter sp. K31L]
MKSQKGNISTEYLLATAMVVAVIFGVQVNDKNLWDMFQDSFQTRHDNYSQSIKNLDNVDLLIQQSQNEEN